MTRTSKVIDFHAHVLPCADHGSNSLATSLEQIALMNNAGVGTVVATPHFYPHIHTVDNFTDKVSSAAEELISAAEARPELCIGAEVLYTEGIEDMDGLERLCIRGTRVLMLELPMTDLDRSIVYSVRRLSTNYTVVLAHIDRYITSSPDMIDALLSVGAKAQINASALFHSSVKRLLVPYISDGNVVALGSDLHMLDKRTYSKFIKAPKKLRADFDTIMSRSEELLQNAEKK